LDIRLNDTRHQVSTNLARRSSGFRWFFSFIAAFSEFEDDSNVIVLLDEPGLNLHGRAQEDFLRFIEERLAERHQVLYTTHSPFMVQASKLHRVRLLEDHSSRTDPDAGAKVSSDVTAVHGDTIFPLQAALGYDLAQNLFVGGSNLVVEGTSDYVYLEALSEHLGSVGREALSGGWTIVPVGGADKVPTFGALLGAHLRDITVLLDASNTGNQRLADLAEEGILDSSRIMTIASITGTKRADMEDLFEPEEYLRLYNAAFGENLTEDALDGSDPILRRIQRQRGSAFDHRRPSTALLRNKAEFLDALSDATLDRFEALFKKINATRGN
jgi:predicted ATP-dependent endonuclease of OLD family